MAALDDALPASRNVCSPAAAHDPPAGPCHAMPCQSFELRASSFELPASSFQLPLALLTRTVEAKEIGLPLRSCQAGSPSTAAPQSH
ncbi:hypothetical protein ST47_g9047 [Ascochyta rabiei]|uniref:Uncharacterized protein n=1 Tax=Didymella rabiei TaxID=5454 RepID=A0A162XWM2_DIDRA|nr:hypothetical protein ST47_g9047 [Ascochyta rabiei]